MIEFAPELILSEHKQKEVLVKNIEWLLEKDITLAKHVRAVLEKFKHRRVDEIGNKELFQMMDYIWKYIDKRGKYGKNTSVQKHLPQNGSNSESHREFL